MNTEQDNLDKRDEFVSLLVRQDLMIRAYLRSMLPTQADVDDVMQEVCVAAWRSFANLDAPENFGKWMCGIARNRVLRFQRKRARSRFVFSEKIQGMIADEGMNELDVRQRELNALEACVQKLPEERRHLLLDAYAGDQSMKSIAEAVGKTPDAIYQIISRVRRQLVKCVQDALAGAH